MKLKALPLLFFSLLLHSGMAYPTTRMQTGHFLDQGHNPSICGMFPGGRIAMASDGNTADADDHGATAMAIAMLHYAGLMDKLVYVGHSSLYRSGCKNSYGNWCDHMDTATIGTMLRFGGDTSIIYSYEADYSDNGQLDQSITAFTAAIEASAPGDSLWIYCAGPMDVVYRAINAASPTKRSYVKCISHSTWNENSKFGGLSYDWNDLKQDFTSDGVEFYEIADQNNSNGQLDFRDESSPSGSNWQWLTKANPPPSWPWLRSRNIDQWFIQNNKAGGFDISDAGMMYWLISGGPQGGCETCGTQEVEYLFKNPCTNVGEFEHLTEKQEFLEAYPNPVGELLHLEFNGLYNNVELKLTSVTGELVYHKRLHNTASIDLNMTGLPQGIFILTADTGKRIMAVRVAKR